jgi:site-specific DNA recombinase
MDEKIYRCAVYTRKSHDKGLDQEFNSLDAQREAAENYIASQRMNGWRLLPDRYDDGGFSGGTMQRPALKHLLNDVKEGLIDIIVVYKMDRLSRSLLDFMNMAEFFEQHNVSFVSVTQDINTSTSSGRMMLNILMTFSQFEREIVTERIKDKIAGAKRRGKYCGGPPPLGYDPNESKKLIVNSKEAAIIEFIFRRYSELGSAKKVAAELNRQGLRTKSWTSKKGLKRPGREFNTSHIYRILGNYIYVGKVFHKGKVFQGEHQAIISEQLWEKVQAMLKTNRVSTGKSSSFTPLKGLIRCGYCGGSMTPTYTVKNNKRYTYFQCLKDSKRGESCCPLKRVPAGDIEKTILQQLAGIFKTPSLLVETYASAQKIEAEERKILQKRMAELPYLREVARAKINVHPNMGNQNDLADLRLEFNRLNQEMFETSARLKRLKTKPLKETDILEALDNINGIWAELFPGEQQRLLNLLIDNIVLRKDSMKMELKTANMTQLVSEIVNIYAK